MSQNKFLYKKTKRDENIKKEEEMQKKENEKEKKEEFIKDNFIIGKILVIKNNLKQRIINANKNKNEEEIKESEIFHLFLRISK